MLKTLRPSQPEDLTECLEQSLVKYLEGSLPYSGNQDAVADEGIDDGNSVISSSSSEEELGIGRSILSCTSVGVGHSRSGSAAQSSCLGSGLSPDVARSSRASRISEYAESEIRKETIKSKAKTKHRKQKYTFKAYHPLRFQSVRQILKIDERAFIKSLSQLRPIGTTGSSKSAFWLSQDSKLFIKTISRTEFKTLRNMFSDYMDRLSDNSFLSQHLGVYRIKFAGFDLRLVVLSNISPSASISLKFDIKGSTNATRQAKRGEQVLKDRDAMNHYFPGFKVSGDDLEHINSTLAKDTEFLAKHNIMDYSVFIAVEQVDDYQPTDGSSKYSDVFFINAVDLKSGSKCILFLGIIDLLVKYGLRKKAEHSIRSIYEDSKQISIVTPEYYRERLLNFVANMFHSATD